MANLLILKLWWIMIQRFSGWVSEKIWNLFTQNKLYFLCNVTSRVLLQTREQLQFAHWCHTDPTLCATWSITYAKATGNIAHAWANLKFSQTTNLKTSALCTQTGSYGYLAAVVYLQRQTTTIFQPTQGKLTVAQVYDYIFLSFFFTQQSPVKMKRTSDQKLTVTIGKVTKYGIQLLMQKLFNISATRSKQTLCVTS